MRGLAYKRFQREKHIKRKEDYLRRCRVDNPPHKYNDRDMWGVISFPRNTYEGNWQPYWIVNHRGKLSKGKIHCSCGMCMAKTRNKGKRRNKYGNYAPAINFKHRDAQRVLKMDWDEKHWNDEDSFGYKRGSALLEDETGYWISDEDLEKLIDSISD